jgi:signal transduction histidine kinase/DNA-binding response OmpR family regulator
MSIRATFITLASVLIVMMAGLFYLMTLVVENQREYAAAETRHYESYRLADQLRHSSDDLTRMARTYAITGDVRYEDYYGQILAIRNGELARPPGYDGIYWDLKTETTDAPDPGGEAISLNALMKRAMFTEEEFGKLAEAQANSDELVALEVRAMAAVKGKYADASGKYTVQGEPDQALARELLHGIDYHKAKARIMAPIAGFFDLVGHRTAEETHTLADKGQALVSKALMMMILIIATLLAGFLVLRFKVAKPIVRLAHAAARVQSGEYGNRLATKSQDELGRLASAFDAMSEAIERDIEERETAATQLAAAQDEAESANRAKSAFLANMSHELRTPMNAVIGYSEMLIEEMEDGGIDDYVADLGKINSAGKHLLSLINDILDLSKIEAGRMDLYLERFDLRQMLGEVTSTIGPLIVKNDNKLVTEFDEDLGVMRADVTKVRQALFNLLSNAAKFTDRGTIGLTAQRVTADTGDRVFLNVTDTGIGIPEEKLDHIFDEFSQADSSTSRDFGGTGLGLSISRRFCQMMGGDITVESKPGDGSRFTIELPAYVDALEVAKEITTESAPEAVNETGVLADVVSVPREGYATILVVDDDDVSRDLLRRTMEGDGYRVVTAASGTECLKLARELKPDAITLDVMMPGMDGWSVLKEIKSDDTVKDIPVIMVSMVHDEEMGFTLGASEYLTKPVDRRRLLDLARRHTTGTGHVLVVEDDDAIRELMRRTFETEGWRVSEAENGKIGLERLVEDRPDIILLDLMMPVMDGFQFMEKLPDVEGAEHIPVFVLTAKILTEQERQFLEKRSEFIASKNNGYLDVLLGKIRASLPETTNRA